MFCAAAQGSTNSMLVLVMFLRFVIYLHVSLFAHTCFLRWVLEFSWPTSGAARSQGSCFLWPLLLSPGRLLGVMRLLGRLLAALVGGPKPVYHDRRLPAASLRPPGGLLGGSWAALGALLAGLGRLLAAHRRLLAALRQLLVDAPLHSLIARNRQEYHHPFGAARSRQEQHVIN